METVQHETTQTALITTEDAATLRQARIVLERLHNDATSAALVALREERPGSEVNAMDYGRMSEASQSASAAIFHFLNIAKHCCDENNVDFGWTT